MDKRARFQLIAQLQGSESWSAVVEELEDQEKKSFEALLHGATKEEVAASVVILRKLKDLPKTARKIIEGGE
jgi:hypothetical protein